VKDRRCWNRRARGDSFSRPRTHNVGRWMLKVELKTWWDWTMTHNHDLSLLMTITVTRNKGPDIINDGGLKLISKITVRKFFPMWIPNIFISLKMKCVIVGCNS